MVFLVQPSDGATWSNPPSFATLDSQLNSASQNYYDASYRQTWFGPKKQSGLDIERLVVTPVLILPKTKAEYEDSFGALQSDCLAAARALGGAWNGGNRDPNYFDRWVVMSNTKMITSTGLAYVGGRFAWTGGSLNSGVAVHEWGHNWGVYHANDWTVPAGDPPRSSNGTNGEYKDGWDIMGEGGTSEMFNPQFRENLGFLERSRGEALDITSSGTYRLYDYVHPFRRQDSGLVRALVIPMASFTDDKRVILGFGHNGGTDGGLGRADWNRNAVTVHSKLSSGSNRIDTTPRSRDVGDANDSSIKIGRTYSEGPNVNGTQMYGGFHVTPVARGSTVFNGQAHEWIDVVINYQNSISNNQPPTASFSQNVFSGAQPGQAFNISVSGSDPNGDTLAYDWDFGDGTYSIVNSATQSKTWSTAGIYLVRCTVTDMKGGTATAEAWVLVGPVTYRNADTVDTMSGLHYRAYTGSWSAIPNFDILNPVASGTVSGFSLSIRPANNNFAVLYTGYIDVPAEDVYQFDVRCDDGARLYIGGQLVVDNNGLKSVPVTKSGNIALKAGKHPVRLEYFNKDNTATLNVDWYRIGQGRTAVPNTALVQPTWAGNAAPSVSLTAPVNGTEVIVNSDVTITADASDDGTVTKVVFFVNGSYLAELTAPPYQTVWPKASVGTQTLEAIAYDATGRWTRSAPVVLNVVSPPPANGFGINFGATGPTNTVYFNEQAGAVYAYKNWNNLAGSLQTNAFALVDHNGLAIPATVRSRSDGAGSGNFNNNADMTSAAGKLMRGGLYRRFDIEPVGAGDLPNPWATVSDVPYASYDVYVYVDPPETVSEDTDAQRIHLTPSEGDVPGPRFVRNSITTNDGKGDYPTYDTWTGFREATAGSLTAPADQLWGNYVVFRGMTAPSFTIESVRRNGTTVADGTTGRMGRYFNAIQVIETVPTQPAIVVRQTGGSTQVSEQGGTDSVTVALAIQPTANVTVTVSPGAQLTASPASLVFTPSNWNVAQVVTVGAVNDSVSEGSHTGSLLFTATGGNYTGVNPRTVAVSIEDNDQALVSVFKSKNAQEQSSPVAGSYQFVRTGLGSYASALTVHFQMSGTAGLSGDYTLSGASVSYNASNGAGTVVIPAGQSEVFLTLTPINDNTPEGSETAILTVQSNAAYSIGTAVATVDIADDDMPNYYTQYFATGQLESTFDLANKKITLTPDGSSSYYSATIESVTTFPSANNIGTQLVTASNDDTPYTVNSISAKFFGTTYTTMYVSPNGYVTFSSSDSSFIPSLNQHFSRLRVAMCFADQYATSGTTTIYVGSTGSGATLRTVVTFNNLHVRGNTSQRYNAQIEFWDSGVITMTWLSSHTGQSVVVGLSNRTNGTPSPFAETNLSALGTSSSANNAPAFSSQPVLLGTSGQTYNYHVVCTDRDNQAMTISAPTKPAWLTLTPGVNGTAVLSGTAPAPGSYAVTLRVSDGSAQTDQAYTLTVVSSGSNTAPVFTSTPGEDPVASVGDTFSYSITTSDADGHAVSLMLVEKPGWMTFVNNGNGTGTLSGTVPDSPITQYSVSLIATDGLASTVQSFVLSVNRPPLIQLLTPSGGVAQVADRSNALQLSASVTDDGKPANPGAVTLTWSQVQGPMGAVFANPNAASTAVSFGAAGVYILRLTASDGILQSTADVVVYVEESAQAALASGLLGYWKFNESSGTTAADASGQGRHLSLSGTYTFGQGREGNAFTHSGSASTFGETTTISHASTPQMTWSAWVRADASPNAGTGIRAILNYTDSNGNARGRLGLKASSSRLLFQSMHGTSGVWETTNYNLPANEWVHVTLQYNNASTANNPVMFINGKAVALTRTTAPSGSFSSTDRLRVGGRSSTAADAWAGRIDEVRVYNRILSAPELQLLLLTDAPNQAPVVTAALRDPIPEGSNQGVVVGTVVDDGLPASPGAVTTQWSKLSGPGTVTFADPSALETEVSFDLPGTYVLRLTASDGAVESHADLQVSIVVSGSVGTRIEVNPTVSTVRPGQVQSFSAILFDQFDNPMVPQPTFSWSVSGGGNISSSGIFTAGETEGGPFTVTATAGSVSGTAQVTVFNQAPTLDPIDNIVLALGQVPGPVQVTVGDAETPASDLVVTATSSNTTLLPNGNITIGGSGSNRTLGLNPASNQTGSTTITVQVSDGHKTATRQFTVTVTNTAPTISSVPNQSIPVNGATSALAFTVGDAETAAGSLTVTRSSSNTTLVPLANVVLGGSGANRTVTVTPAANQVGTTTITLTVSDGNLTAQTQFTVTVTNTAPTISSVPNQSIPVNGATSALAFTVGDAETAAGSLTVTRSSSNTTLVPLANVVLGGSGANRTVTVTPAANQVGTTTITLTVSDGLLSSQTQFTVTVTNTAPTISSVSNQTIPANGTTGSLVFTVGDTETAAGSLTVTRSSSNTTLVPLANVVLGGSGANRTVTVTPAANQTGTATITLTVSDGLLTAQTQFTVTVTETFASWISQYGELGGLNGVQDDPDGDGVPNLMEYAFKLNPGQAGRIGLPQIALVMDSGTGKEHLTISYRQRRGGSGTTGVDYAAEGVRYVVETTTNLMSETWNSGSSVVEAVGTPIDNGDGTETVSVRLKSSTDQLGNKAFIRIRLVLE
jgi:hypothetical protein